MSKKLYAIILLEEHTPNDAVSDTFFGNPLIGSVQPVSTQYYTNVIVPTVSFVRIGFVTVALPSFTTVKTVNLIQAKDNHLMGAFFKAWGITK